MNRETPVLSASSEFPDIKLSVLILDGDCWQRETLAAALAYEGCHAEHTGATDIAIPGSKNISEIQVDAVTGQVVSREVETLGKQFKEANEKEKQHLPRATFGSKDCTFDKRGDHRPFRSTRADPASASLLARATRRAHRDQWLCGY